jgi:hypothetical protein
LNEGIDPHRIEGRQITRQATHATARSPEVDRTTQLQFGQSPDEFIRHDCLRLSQFEHACEILFDATLRLFA